MARPASLRSIPFDVFLNIRVELSDKIIALPDGEGDVFRREAGVGVDGGHAIADGKVMAGADVAGSHSVGFSGEEVFDSLLQGFAETEIRGLGERLFRVLVGGGAGDDGKRPAREVGHAADGIVLSREKSAADFGIRAAPGDLRRALAGHEGDAAGGDIGLASLGGFPEAVEIVEPHPETEAVMLGESAKEGDIPPPRLAILFPGERSEPLEGGHSQQAGAQG